MSMEGAWVPSFKVVNGNGINGVLIAWTGTFRLIQALC